MEINKSIYYYSHFKLVYLYVSRISVPVNLISIVDQQDIVLKSQHNGKNPLMKSWLSDYDNNSSKLIRKKSIFKVFKDLYLIVGNIPGSWFKITTKKSILRKINSPQCKLLKTDCAATAPPFSGLITPNNFGMIHYSLSEEEFSELAANIAVSPWLNVLRYNFPEVEKFYQDKMNSL